MTFVGSIIVFSLALVGIAFTALLLASGWNTLRDEVVPGFRSNPPRARSLALTFLGVVLPILLIAAFTAYFAIWLLGMLLAADA